MTSLVTSLTVQHSGRPFCPNIKKVDYSHQYQISEKTCRLKVVHLIKTRLLMCSKVQFEPSVAETEIGFGRWSTVIRSIICVIPADALPLQKLEVALPLRSLLRHTVFLGESPLAWPPLWFRLPIQALSGRGRGMNAGAWIFVPRDDVTKVLKTQKSSLE